MIKGFRSLVDFPVLDLKSKKDITAGYKLARESAHSIMLVERQDLYATE